MGSLFVTALVGLIVGYIARALHPSFRGGVFVGRAYCGPAAQCEMSVSVGWCSVP